jgi:hypothetical protein
MPACIENGYSFARLDIPDARCLIVGCRNNTPAIGTESGAHYIAGMSTGDSDSFACFEIPDTCRRIASCVNGSPTG